MNKEERVVQSESIPNDVAKILSNSSMHIENFFSIKKLSCNFKNVNIIIGPQAAGKSLIIKLVAFFTSVFNFTWSVSTLAKFDFEKLESVIIANFTAIFPNEYIKNENFVIDFRYKNFIISIYKKNKKIVVNFNNEFIDFLTSVKKSDDFGIDHFIKEFLITENPFPDYLFIPDNRSLFTSVIKNNIFKMILQGKKVKMDYFLKNFAARYEEFVKNANESINTHEFKEIFHGEYHKIDNEEFIINNNKKIKLEYGSSGQQEVISLLLALHAQENSKNTVVCIEEPEAHLFPSTQKLLIEHIISTYSKMGRNSQFWMTTHSPYVLTTINNLIAAHTVGSIDKKSTQVEEIISKKYWLPFDDVSCWYINDGILIDLMNADTKLIKVNEIDNISDQLASDFDKLLELEYGEEYD